MKPSVTMATKRVPSLTQKEQPAWVLCLGVQPGKVTTVTHSLPYKTGVLERRFLSSHPASPLSSPLSF